MFQLFTCRACRHRIKISKNSGIQAAFVIRHRQALLTTTPIRAHNCVLRSSSLLMCATEVAVRRHLARSPSRPKLDISCDMGTLIRRSGIERWMQKNFDAAALISVPFQGRARTLSNDFGTLITKVAERRRAIGFSKLNGSRVEPQQGRRRGSGEPTRLPLLLGGRESAFLSSPDSTTVSGRGERAAEPSCRRSGSSWVSAQGPMQEEQRISGPAAGGLPQQPPLTPAPSAARPAAER